MSDCHPDPSNPLSSCSARIGITFIVQTSSLSFIAVVSLLAYVSYIAFQNRRKPGWRLITSHLDLYLLGLLASDLIQSLGGIMDIKWIALADVTLGSYCTAQGVLQQFGEVGVALCSLAIAVHTFAELSLRWKEPKSFAIPIIVLGLYAIFLTLIVGVGYALHHRSNYYGKTGYWCWITSHYLRLAIGLEYLWFWIAALVNLLVYVPIFFVLKGIIVVEPTDTRVGYRVRRTTPDERKAFRTSRDEDKMARQMLYYPAVYIITVIPLAIARLPSLAHPEHPMPFAALVFGCMLFNASGLFNVIVYTATRPALLRPSVVKREAPQENTRNPQLFWDDTDQADKDGVSSIRSQHLEDTTPVSDPAHPTDITEEGKEDDVKDTVASELHV